MIPSASQIYANLVGIMGPGDGDRGLALRREARRRMLLQLESLLPQYGIPPGGDRYPDGRIDRRSVYAGATTPTLYHKLEMAFRTDGPPSVTRRAVEHYHRALVRAEEIFQDLHLLTVVVSREHHSGLVAHGERRVPNTFEFGGLDHLGAEMSRMQFLPRSVRRRWTELRPGTGCEPNGRCHPIHAASIPAADELVAYAAMLRHRSDRFRERLEEEFGVDRASALLSGGAAPERRAWTQLSFARPNGLDYEPSVGESMLERSHSGLATILSAAHHYEDSEGRTFTLRAIFDEPRFGRMASVRIARARAVEATVLDYYGLLASGDTAGDASFGMPSGTDRLVP